MTNFIARERLARQTLQEHGLDDWTFSWDSARTRGGICRYREKKISISRIVSDLNDDSWFVETLLHEVAHALVGTGHGHDRVWQAKLLSLGGNGNRCHTGKVKKEVHKVIHVCSKCGITGTKARLGKNANKMVCRYCLVHVQWFDLRNGARLDNHFSADFAAIHVMINAERKRLAL